MTATRITQLHLLSMASRRISRRHFSSAGRRAIESIYRVPDPFVSVPRLPLAASLAESYEGPTRIHGTGLLHTKDDREGLLWISHVLPMRRSTLDFRSSLVNKANIERIVGERCIPSSNVDIKEILCHPKDGGVFVRYRRREEKKNKLGEKSIDKEETDTRTRKDDVVRMVREHLNANSVRLWYTWWKRVHAYEVFGEPWMEDMHRYPSNKLYVEFHKGKNALSLESIYFHFREYGRIIDVNPAYRGDSLCVPRSVVIQFARLESAVAARNCLHLFELPETTEIPGKEKDIVLRILYENYSQMTFLFGYISNHPKASIPLAVAILAMVLALVEPIRQWFVEKKIKHKFEFELFGTASLQISDLPENLAKEVKLKVSEIKTVLHNPSAAAPIRFSVTSQATQEAIADEVSNLAEHSLVIDCLPIYQSLYGSVAIRHLARQVGFKPLFPTAIYVVDSTLQNIGQPDTADKILQKQSDHLFSTLTNVMHHLVAKHKLEVELEKKIESDKVLENRPVIILKNYSGDEHSKMMRRLTEWAERMAAKGYAYVIVIKTND